MRRSSAFPVAIAVIVALVAGGCSSLGLGSSPSPSPSPAPASLPPSPSPLPSPRKASLPPSPSPRPSPSPVGSASPSPSAVSDPAAVIAAFIRVGTDPNFSAHIALRATMDIGPLPFNLDSTTDVAGAESETILEIGVGDQTAVSEVIVADGRTYSRLNGGTWRVVVGPVDPARVNPFARLVAGGVTYLRTQGVGGRLLHRLRIKDALPIDPSEISTARVEDVQVERATFEVLVDDAGRPVLGYYDFLGSALVDGERQPITIDADYRFSKVGEPIVVEAPF